MASKESQPLAPEVEHAEPLALPTPRRITIINFRTSSTIPIIVTRPLATYMFSPLLKSEMGLAVETWHHIIHFLAREPVALLACALTCRGLREPAQAMIRALFRPTISTNHDLDTLVEEVRGSPARARCISGLVIVPERDMASVPVFSVIPFRLARILPRIKALRIGFGEGDSCSTLSGHPCTWSFYGRAFRSVTTLDLSNVCFPSFFDFTSLIISLPALTSLSIAKVQCISRRVPVSVMQRRQKQGFKLEKLLVSSMRQDQDAKVWFLAAFVSWFIQRRGIEVRELTMYGHTPHSHWLLQRLEGHLRTLIIYPESINADFANIQLAALSKLEINQIRVDTIPWLQIIMPSICSIESYPNMLIRVHPSEKDFHSPAWKVIDVVIFAHQYRAHRTSKSRSIILRRPRVTSSWKLNDPINKSTFPCDPNTAEDVLMFTLLPLYSSCRGIWDRLIVDIWVYYLYNSVRDHGLEL